MTALFSEYRHKITKCFGGRCKATPEIASRLPLQRRALMGCKQLWRQRDSRSLNLWSFSVPLDWRYVSKLLRDIFAADLIRSHVRLHVRYINPFFSAFVGIRQPLIRRRLATRRRTNHGSIIRQLSRQGLEKRVIWIRRG